MQRDEVALAADWAAAEGWNPGLHDAECFYAADPKGFLVAELDGEPVGCISAVRYEETFGFLGLYIVLPEYRGKGYGLKLWNAAMEYLAGRNVGLDGVVEQQDNYRKSGFVLEHRNVRYELKELPADGGDKTSNAELIPLAQVPFAHVLKYDSEIFRFRREEFLSAWIAQQGAIAIGALQDGKLCGYGVIRPCRQGWKIGPLFSDSEAIASDLFAALISSVQEGPVYLDVPQTNRAAVNLAEQYQMVPMFETARMYTSGDPGLPLDRIYGITTFELG